MQAQNAVHVEHAQMLARPAGYAEAQRPILRLFHAASVILHEETQIARVRLRPDFDIAVVHVANAVNHRVFHNRLKHQLGHHAAHQRVVHLDFAGEAILKANELNVYVSFQQLKLLPERHKLVAGDARAQNLRQILRQRRHLRHAVRHAHPFHRIQRVIEEMRVELRLHHADARIVQLLLALHRAPEVQFTFRHHLVEADRQLPQLALAARHDARAEFAQLHPLHRRRHLPNRARHLPAEHQRAPQAQQQADRAERHADEHHQVRHLAVEHARLAEQQRKPADRLGLCRIGQHRVAVAERLARQHPLAQLVQAAFRPGRSGIVDQPPLSAQQHHAVGRVQPPAEQLAEAVPADLRQQIAPCRAANGGHAPRLAEKDGVLPVGHAQNAPIRIEGRVLLLPAQGAQAHAVRADDHKLGHLRHLRRLPDQRRVDRSRVRRVALLERRTHPFIPRQRVKRPLHAGKRLRKLPGHSGELRPRRFLLPLCAGGNHHREQQRKAQDDRHERHADHRQKNARLKAHASSFPHGASSFMSACQRLRISR